MSGTSGKKAFTLTELVIALSVTAVVGLAVTTIATALSSAHGRAEARRTMVQSARSGLLRIESHLRKSKLVAGADEGALVCWMGDANGDESINVNEIVLVQLEGDTRQIIQRQVVFPGSLPPGMVEALNASIPLAELTDPDDAADILNGAFYTPYLSTVVLAIDVDGFEVTTDEAAPFTVLVLLRLATGSGVDGITLTSAAGLRVSSVGDVVVVEGEPVLRFD